MQIEWCNYVNCLPADRGLSPVLRQVESTVITYSECHSHRPGSGPFSAIKSSAPTGRRDAVSATYINYNSSHNRIAKLSCMYFKSYRAMIGGPMVNYREDARQWFTVGVAWMGDSTTNCQGSNKPNIYARSATTSTGSTTGQRRWQPSVYDDHWRSKYL